MIKRALSERVDDYAGISGMSARLSIQKSVFMGI